MLLSIQIKIDITIYYYDIYIIINIDMNICTPILLKINSLTDELFEIETSGICIQFNKKYYMVTVHQGLPIKEVQITLDRKIFDFKKFIICGWNDLIIVSLDFKPSNLFVFKQFVKKQININSKLEFDSNLVKYIENDSMPICMIPSNPTNLYYKIKIERDKIKDGDCGKPIHINNRLIGIIGKVMEDIVYVIPFIYIEKSLEKKDNSTIYTINCTCDTIIKFNKFKQQNNSIYYKKMNCIIPFDTFIVLEGDIDIYYNVLTNVQKNKQPKRDMFIPFENKLIVNSNQISQINEISIQINSCFIHLIKLCYKDEQLIKEVFDKMENHQRIDYTIKNVKYVLYF